MFAINCCRDRQAEDVLRLRGGMEPQKGTAAAATEQPAAAWLPTAGGHAEGASKPTELQEPAQMGQRLVQKEGPPASERPLSAYLSPHVREVAAAEQARRAGARASKCQQGCLWRY